MVGEQINGLDLPFSHTQLLSAFVEINRIRSEFLSLEEKDKKRSLYYRHYTGKTWGDSRNYHVSIDTSVVGIERAAAWIVELFNSEE